MEKTDPNSGEELEKRLAVAHAKLRAQHARCRRLEAQLAWTQGELHKVQAHLTTLLSGRILRYTRFPRRVWYRLKRIVGR